MILYDDWNLPWNWSDFCSTGVRPFASDSNDLLPCFQEIILQLPIYTLFAAISAYHFGAYTKCLVRDRTQLWAIYLRAASTILLAILPVLKLFEFYRLGVRLYAADILVVCTECVMWVVHSGYLLTSRTFGELSHRGPLVMIVMWLAIFVLDAVWLRSSRHFDWWPWSLATLLLDVFYGLTLIPNGKATYTAARYPHANTETTSLLSPRYTHFHFDFNEAHLGHAQDEANCFSRLYFHWVGPLISKGVAGNLRRIEDLFDLPDALNIPRISEKLQISISRSKNLFWSLHKAFGKEFYLIGILRFIADISSFAGPLLLGGLLSQGYSSDDTNEENYNWAPYWYALGLFGTQLIYTFCSCHFNWRMSMIGMKMRIGVVSAIYRKALEARGLKNARPEVLNLMSTDTDRIVNSCISFHSFWSIPFQLFTTLYLLYTQLGAAFIAGVIFAVALIPINRWLAKRIGHYSQGLMTAKDARISATSETITGAKQIKLNAWEDVFIKKILNFRQDEMKFLAKRKYLDAWCVYFWATTPVLMCFLTFGVSVWMGNPLVASTTYTSVALLNLLIGPLNAFPWVLNGLIEAWISVKRVQELMDLENLDFSSYYDPIMKGSSMTSVDDRPVVLQFKDATFEYDTINNDDDVQTTTFTLENVNMEVKKGELVCIEGPVGAGKSSFIAAIVAGINCLNGSICLQDFTSGFGYVPQTPWLQRGTIRDNIVWGSTFDEKWYKTVLFACALNDDLLALGGDLVGVGENGRTLSGGQRARVALARAVYQDKKIYLLDDILASLDAHVARHIIKHCILNLLKDKTRIIVTRSVTLFYHANQILHIENGKLTPSEYMSESIDLSLEDSNDEADMNERRASIDLDALQMAHEKKSVDSIMLDETREYGNLSMNVFACYWKAVTTPLGLIVLLSVVLMQVTRNLSDAWLAHWVTDTTLDNNTSSDNTLERVIQPSWWKESINNSTPTGHTTAYYLSIFASLALTNSLMTLARAFLFAFAGLKAAKYIHDKLLNKVIYAKFSFFDVTSVGRILNRFSSDTYTVDDSLPFILNILLAQVVGLVGSVFISLYAMPWLSLVVIPMVPVYLSLQHRYRHASRDIKRLSSNALSPLYTHFTETLQGLVTIRTMRVSIRFQRDFHAKLEESIKAQLTSSAAQNWLSIRLQLLGAFLVGGAGILAAITSAHATNPGLVGLAISYALSITHILGGVLNAVAETEQELVAVERIEQYLQLEGEENAEGCINPPFGWPTQGALSFKNVQLSYREHLSPAIRNLNFKTEAFERLAIVGRTGAGKTSILAALMRIAPLSKGEIILDSVNLKTLALSVLRDRIGIIPQEPFLFEGTVRENLDPRSSYYDSEIWHAITNCSAATYLVQSLGGLDGKLDRGGINLSAGQKQLLCLARALLKNSKVICIDEGTSNLDNDTEFAMNQALRSSFKSSTVIVIAHRLNGLHNMDRIIVMDQAEIKEQGSPQELASNTNSLFYSMLQAQHISIEEFTKGE
ncbi:ATP-binding cassette sub-family C member 10 [Lucilia cuprina]|uniref:ATP-binding cassette sub-family C member 10 n=1 Tax=Lucilia cuprina TaxID=7375 RepID=UPI001F05E3E9|nr:ATP-binding cassette sub-family C member 10 [Lucilia cuprina]